MSPKRLEPFKREHSSSSHMKSFTGTLNGDGRRRYPAIPIEDWAIAKGSRRHNMKRLFRTDKDIAEEFVGLAVNKRLLIGKYLLLFPHFVEGKTFQTTQARKCLCWLVAVLLTSSSFILYISASNNRRDSFIFLLWAPLFSSYTAVLINQIWMQVKKNKLDDFLCNLQECRPYLEVDSTESTMLSLLPVYCQALFNIGYWFYKQFTEPPKKAVAIIIYIYFMQGLFLNIAMLEQFILLLSLVRKQISRTALLSDTDQDALIAAAKDLNKVFSPHLLIVIMTFFVAILGRIYISITIRRITNFDHIVVIVMQCFPIWRVVWNCQRFVEEVEQLYNRVYHYLLTHEDKIDKRMELHLGMKRKFVFSAGGMFNVDFKLLSGMITTAATYLVVLLQFTVDKEEPPTNTTIPHSGP